jgi:hypothetical protein
MSNPALRVVQALTGSRIGGLLLNRLPPSVAETLRDFGEADADETPAFALGPVREGTTVRATNIVRGSVEGGSVRAVNLVLGDVRSGELKAVNVVVGSVYGGELRDVHIVVGDVHGGHFERCYAVIGDIHGGSGRVSRLLGSVHGGQIEVGERVEPEAPTGTS